MKKILLSAMALLAFGLAGFSQTGVYYSGIGNRTLRETGLMMRPEYGVAYTGELSVNGWYHIGYQFTPNIYFGGGLGFLMELEKGYSPYTGYYGNNNLETLFASLRWYWLDGRSSPFFEVNLGIGRGDFTHDSYYYYDDYSFYDFYYDRHSVEVLPFVTIAIGYNIKGFDIKVGTGNFREYNFGAFFTLGYIFLIKK